MIGICLLAILTSAATLFTSRVLTANMSQAASGIGHDLADARELQILGLRSIADAHACLLTGGKKFASSAQSGSSLVRDAAARMQSQMPDPRARALLARVLAAEEAHRLAFTRALAVAGTLRSESSALYPDAVLTRGEEFESALDALVAHVESGRVRSLAFARRDVDSAETFLSIIATVTVLLLVAAVPVAHRGAQPELPPPADALARRPSTARPRRGRRSRRWRRPAT